MSMKLTREVRPPRAALGELRAVLSDAQVLHAITRLICVLAALVGLLEMQS